MHTGMRLVPGMIIKMYKNTRNMSKDTNFALTYMMLAFLRK